LARFQSEAQAALHLAIPISARSMKSGGKTGKPILLVEFLNGVIPKHLTAGKPVETDVLPGLTSEIADGLDAMRSEGTASAGC
jgi:hypothetical protein